VADIAKVSNVATADIAKVNSVAKADIAKVGNTDMPAGGATLWCVVAEDGGVATATHADLNDWTGYDATGLGSQDHITLAHGKDGSGNPLWVAGTQDGNREIRYSSDPTDGADWADVDIDGDVFGVAWGNNVWIAVGQLGEVHRSTNGTTWAQLDISGATGYSSSATIWDVVTDGAGNWMCIQAANVFHSTDDGATWALLIHLADAGGLNIGSGFTGTSMAYTASRWCVFLWASSGSRTLVCHAAASDTSAWAICTVGGSAPTGQALIGKPARRMAAGDGTVIIVQANRISRSTDGGQDWTLYGGSYDAADPADGLLPRTDARDVATNGLGTWVTVFDSGRVAISTNDGLTWVEQSGGQLTFPSNTQNIEAVASNVFLPV